MLDGIEPMLRLAEAGNLDLGRASDLVTDSMAGLGLEVNELDGYLDMVAKTAASSNTDIDALMEAYVVAGGTFKRLNIPLEESNAFLGTLANRGFKASEAGTAMNAIMARLTDVAGPAGKQLKKMGINAFDSKGNFRGMEVVMTEVAKSMDKMTDAEKAHAMKQIAGLNHGKAFSAMVAGVGDEYAELKGKIIDSDGALNKMAKTMQDNLKGDLAVASSALAELGLQVWDILAPKVRGITKLFSNMVVGVQKLSPKVKIAVVAIAGIAAAIGPTLVGLGLLIKTVGMTMQAFAPLMLSIAKSGGILGSLKAVFLALTGPIGLTIGAIALLTTGFTIAYKKSETFRNIINSVGTGIKKAVGFVTGFTTAITDLFKGDNFGGVTLLYKLGLSSDQINMIKSVVEVIKGAFTSLVDRLTKNFNAMKKVVSSVVGAISGFFKSKISEIRKFWDVEGAGLLQAFSNIFNAIWFVVGPIFKLIGAIVKTTMSVIMSVIKVSLPIIKSIFSVTFTVILAIVKMVWENIRGVIDGGLKIIMGLVKVFSGLFTGNFSKMWEGIKQIFFGTIQFIWNYMQLMFWGKMLKGIMSLGKLLLGSFRSTWTAISNVFTKVISTIVKFVKNMFNGMKSNVSSLMKSIQNVISSIWNAILNVFKVIIKGIVSFAKNWFTNLKNNINSIFNGIKGLTSKTWGGIKNSIVNPIKSAVSTAKSKFNSFKSSVGKIFGSIKDTVAKRVSDMVANVKGMPGRMGEAISKTAGKAKDGMLNVGRKMADGIASSVNGVRTAVKWVLGKIGMGDKIWGKFVPANSLKWYAHGTGSHEGGPAVVGDGVGKNKGQELITLPNRKQLLSPDTPTLMNLPKGTSVKSAIDTRKILNLPHYAWGDKAWNNIKSGTKKAGGAVKKAGKKTWGATKKGAGTVKDTAIDVWDYASNPGKLLNIALDKFGVKAPSMDGVLGSMLKGSFKKVKSGVKDFIKKQLDLSGGPSPAGKGAKAWRGMIKHAAGVMKEKLSDKELNGIIAQIHRESGGNDKITQSASVVDVNTLNGNPAKGLLQYIPQTFNKYKMKGHGNIFAGYDQLLAFFNNNNWRNDLPYGSRGWGPKGGRKYKRGTNFVPEDGPAYLHKGEAVIPALYNKPTDAMKLLALVGKDIDRDNKQSKQLPNVKEKNINNQSEKIYEMIRELSNNTEQMIHLLTKLLLKDNNLYIGDEETKQLKKKIDYLNAISAQ